MAIIINKDTLDEFKTITGLDVSPFLRDAVSFLSQGYNRIVAYYSGTAKQADRGDFIEFERLQRLSEVTFVTFEQAANRLSNLKFWLLLEYFEDIDSRFRTLKKINKWSRSSLTDFGYNPSLQAHYTLKPKQSLERVSQDVLQQSNPQDDWVQIALTNQLQEEDYTVDGGNDLQLSFPKINRGININAVVDVMTGKSIYGKDFDRKIQFDPIAGDLKVLDYDDTVSQSVDILANLRKNDNPDFPTHGLQSGVVVGSNRASLNFPVIGRQLTETFATDDSLKNFQLLNIGIDQDTLNMSFQVSTRLNETIEGQIVV